MIFPVAKATADGNEGSFREVRLNAGHLMAKTPASSEEPNAEGSPRLRDAAGMTSTTAVLLLADLRPAHWPWGWNRIAFSRWLPSRTRGLRFMKTLGSGRGGGFGLVPSPSHQGVFCLFDERAAADDFIARSPLVARYREASSECLLLTLRPCSARGSWDGVALAAGEPLAADAPVAALTRASIRPLAAPAFWAHAPAAQAGLATAPGCELAIGLGEAPLLRQATFSLWRNTAAMDAYARTGAHQQAIRAAWQQHFFSESMFVRFAPLAIEGRWQGRCHG